MKIVFIGCVEFSYCALECLLTVNGVEVVGVISRNDSVVNSDFCSLKEIAQQKGIPYLMVSGNEQEQMRNWILKVKPDVIYCIGWSYLLNKEILLSAPMGVIGYHPAALPQNRGRHPIIWALILGLQETASTFFFMDEGADSGDIISQMTIIINEYDDAATLYKKMISAALQQIPEFTSQLMSGRNNRIKQNHNQANYWRKRNKNDGCIDWRMSAISIYNLVRGLSKPYVGAHCLYKGTEVKIWKVELTDIEGNSDNIEPGKVVTTSNNMIYVKCGEGVVKIVSHEFTEVPRKDCYL